MIKIVYNNQSHKYKCSIDDDYKSMLLTIKGVFKDLPTDDRLQLLTGYPPVVLTVNSDDKITINSGSIVTIRDGEPGSIMSLESVFNTNIKEKESLLSLLPMTLTINKLLTKGFSRTVIEQALDVSIDDVELAESICNDISSTTISNDKRKFKRVIIDADNSCLFNALGYCLCNNTTLSDKFRNMIIQDINNNTDIYTNDILGKERNEYCKWLKQNTSWGGEIEMNILSKLFDITINAVDIETNVVYKYESNNNNNCVYVIYDGIHYDAIALSNDNDNDNITIFDKNDINALNSIKKLALDLKDKRQYVNINSQKFEIQCLVCSQLLKGQKEAVEHAKTTGHQNFSQA